MPIAPSSLDAGPLGPVGDSDRKTANRRRDFAILSGTSAVSQVGSMSVAAAGPLLALALTRSPVAAGYVTAASVLPGLLLHVPAGLVADRIDRRKVMWTSQLVRIAFAVITCSCLAFKCDPVVVLVVAALVDGSCAVFYEIAEIATVPELVSKRSLNLAIGSNEAKLNASMLLGRPLGGALLAISPIMPWLLTACTSFFPVVALLMMRRNKKRAGVEGGADAIDAPAAEVGREMPVAGDPGSAALNLHAVEAAPTGKPVPDLALRAALEGLLRDSFSRVVLAVCVLANLFFQVIVLQQLLLAEQMGMPSYLVGLLLAFSGLGGFLGAVGSPWILRRRKSSASVVLCVLAWVPMVWLATTWKSPAVGLAMWGMCSVIGAHVNVALRAHQANEFPGELLGRITGITRFLSVGAVALGALSGGWILRILGIDGTAVLVNVAFAAIAVGLVLVLHLTTVRNLLVTVTLAANSVIRVIASDFIIARNIICGRLQVMRMVIAELCRSAAGMSRKCVEVCRRGVGSGRRPRGRVASEAPEDPSIGPSGEQDAWQNAPANCSATLGRG